MIENFSDTNTEPNLNSLSDQEFSSAASEITDHALSEIGRRMAEMEIENIEKGDSLALAYNEPTSKPTEDFMGQKLNTLLTGGEQNYSVETDSNGEDHFDTDVVLCGNGAESSGNGNEAKREISMSASFVLTEEETAHERLNLRRRNEPENEFYNALTAGVL